MVERIYYKEEVIPLVFRMALELFRKEEGIPEEIFEKHKKMILDLLKDKQISSREIVADENYDFDWTDKVASKFYDRLSKYQKSILKTLINGNGEATITELRDGILEAGLKWISSRTAGGALAGLTRKCQQLSIPPIWFIREDKYVINKEAETYLSKYIFKD
jgi:hypothetical protein